MVTLHACERYMQRIMELDCKEGSLSRDQAIQISRAIIKILLNHHPQAYELTSGVFNCKEDNLACIMQDGTVVTIKEIKASQEDYDYYGRHKHNSIEDARKMSEKRHSKYKKENTDEPISKYRKRN